MKFKIAELVCPSRFSRIAAAAVLASLLTATTSGLVPATAAEGRPGSPSVSAQTGAPAPKITPAADPAAAPAPVPSAAAAPAAQPGGALPPEAMNGISFAGLTDAQRELAVAILNENGCDCSCGMKLAVCRRDDSKCGRSLALANQVIDLIKAGKGREEIVRTALSPPSKFVQFDIPAGDAPSVGPADAKVVILHYLDYQ